MKKAVDLKQVEQFAREFLIPMETKYVDSEEFPRDLAERMYACGYFTNVTPRELGGEGASVAELAWLIRGIGYGSPSAAATLIGNLLGYTAFAMYSQTEIRQKVCREFLSSYKLWGFAMTEAEAGSDLQTIKTTAIKTHDGYILNGEKNFITNATVATDFSVFAQLFDKQGNNLGISCFYVPGKIEGLTRGPALKKIGWKKANTGQLLFKDIHLPETNLLGAPGQGLRILTHCLNRSKTLLAAMSVGISQRAMDLAVERLQETVRFGKPLIEQPAIRHLFAKLYTRVEAAWLLTCQAAETWDAGRPAVREASMAKLFGGATAMEVTGHMMELFGARGYLRENEISRLQNDAKAIEIVEGPSLVQELLIAKEVLPKTQKYKTLATDPYKLQSQEVKGAV